MGMAYDAWMLAAMEENGYMTTSESLINRVAAYLAASPNDVIGNEEFINACIACNVDPYFFSKEDLNKLQKKLR